MGYGAKLLQERERVGGCRVRGFIDSEARRCLPEVLSAGTHSGTGVERSPAATGCSSPHPSLSSLAFCLSLITKMTQASIGTLNSAQDNSAF